MVLEEKTYCRSANVLVSISLRDALIHALPTKVVIACVQTSPISFVATKEIGDVCTQAKVVNDAIGREREEEPKLCDKLDNNFV